MTDILRFTLWLLLLLMGLTPAMADDDCRTEAQIRHDMQEAYPNAVVSTIADADLPAFLKGFNAAPPTSDAHADHVLIVSLEGDPIIHVGFFEHGCLASQGNLLRKMFDDIMSGA